MTAFEVAAVGDLDDGERLVVELEGREVGVFNVGGEYYAYANWCAHQAGPCCEGRLTGTTEATWDRETLELSLEYARAGEILNCPWHGWEYDVRTGECLSRAGVRLPTYPVTVEDGRVVVEL